MKIYKRTIEDEELLIKLEKANDIYNNKLNIMKVCLDDRFFNQCGERFSDFKKEYDLAFEDLNKLKKEVEEKYIFPNFSDCRINWWIIYSSKELYAEVKDE